MKSLSIILFTIATLVQTTFAQVDVGPYGALDRDQLKTTFNRENVLESKRIFKSLAACYNKLDKSGNSKAKVLAVFLSKWDQEVFYTSRGQSYTFMDMINGKRVYPYVPMSVTSSLLNTLKLLKNKFTPLCPGLKTPRNGTRKYDQLYSSLISLLSYSHFRALYVTFLQALPLIQSKLENNNEQAHNYWLKLVNKLPENLVKEVSFVKEKWFSHFLIRSYKSESLREAHIEAFDLSTEDFSRIMNRSFKILRPYALSRPGKAFDNNIYPFVNYHTDSYDQEILSCLSKLGTSVNKTDFKAKGLAGNHNKLTSKIHETCPSLSYWKVSFILSIHDRMTWSILPESIRLYMNKNLSKISWSSEVGNEILNSSKDDQFESLLKGIEQYTFKQADNLRSTAYNHYSTSLFLKCSLEKEGEEEEDIRNLIATISFAYQVFDAYSKSANFDMKSDKIAKGAVSDVNLWIEALDRKCAF